VVDEDNIFKIWNFARMLVIWHNNLCIPCRLKTIIYLEPPIRFTPPYWSEFINRCFGLYSKKVPIYTTSYLLLITSNLRLAYLIKMMGPRWSRHTELWRDNVQKWRPNSVSYYSCNRSNYYLHLMASSRISTCRWGWWVSLIIVILLQ